MGPGRRIAPGRVSSGALVMTRAHHERPIELHSPSKKRPTVGSPRRRPAGAVMCGRRSLDLRSLFATSRVRDEELADPGRDLHPFSSLESAESFHKTD